MSWSANSKMLQGPSMLYDSRNFQMEMDFKEFEVELSEDQQIFAARFWFDKFYLSLWREEDNINILISTNGRVYRDCAVYDPSFDVAINVIQNLN